MSLVGIQWRKEDTVHFNMKRLMRSNYFHIVIDVAVGEMIKVRQWPYVLSLFDKQQQHILWAGHLQ
jgi:hypothetical protein